MLPLLLAFFLMTPHEPHVLTVPQAERQALSTNSLEDLARDIAREHDLNEDRFANTVACESGWDIHARGDYINGEPTSFGLVQLHYPTRDWGIATSTADDPAYALNVMADEWVKGNFKKWSCWTRLYGS